MFICRLCRGLAACACIQPIYFGIRMPNNSFLSRIFSVLWNICCVRDVSMWRKRFCVFSVGAGSRSQSSHNIFTRTHTHATTQTFDREWDGGTPIRTFFRSAYRTALSMQAPARRACDSVCLCVHVKNRLHCPLASGTRWRTFSNPIIIYNYNRIDMHSRHNRLSHTITCEEKTITSTHYDNH